MPRPKSRITQYTVQDAYQYIERALSGQRLELKKKNAEELFHAISLDDHAQAALQLQNWIDDYMPEANRRRMLGSLRQAKFARESKIVNLTVTSDTSQHLDHFQKKHGHSSRNEALNALLKELDRIEAQHSPPTPGAPTTDKRAIEPQTDSQATQSDPNTRADKTATPSLPLSSPTLSNRRTRQAEQHNPQREIALIALERKHQRMLISAILLVFFALALGYFFGIGKHRIDRIAEKPDQLSIVDPEALLDPNKRPLVRIGNGNTWMRLVPLEDAPISKAPSVTSTPLMEVPTHSKKPGENTLLETEPITTLQMSYTLDPVSDP
ncbi:MAG: hypothetical protein HQL50_01000 [Magnetococcales bacterium]|nr:hypothetical protein [Magnetococcales bacterium]